MTHEDAIAIVAEKLLDCRCAVVQGFTVLRNDYGMDREFDPFSNAQHDYEVLEAVRERLNIDGHCWFSSHFEDESPLYYEPGDYCMAAAQTIMGNDQ